MSLPTHKPQEIPYDHADSSCLFRPKKDMPFLATPAAIALYGDAILTCLSSLQKLALFHNGLDYLQVFTDPEKDEALWFIEDGPGGAITALLPSEY